jgi:putative transposase
MEDNNVINIKNPQKESYINDEFTIFLRQSAQKMLKIAIEAEIDEFISLHSDKVLSDGRQRVVRNGHLPERSIQSGIGRIGVRVPRVRDRLKTDQEKIKFYPSWIPKYMRRTRTIDCVLPLLYLKGISTKDFSDALLPIFGEDAKNLSPAVISKLKSEWTKEYESFVKADLSGDDYVYWWVDGVYLQARMESEKSCILVIIGATKDGTKKLVAMNDGFRESKESWLHLLRDMKHRGMKIGPKLAVGDGALGFWGAIAEEYPETKHQRCWVHKTRNVMDKLPKSLQEDGKKDLKEIYMSPGKKESDRAFEYFIDKYGAKYPKASECLKRDKKELLEFYNFPAEHWQSIRTTNPIESTFASVRHRTIKSKGAFSRETIICSVFKLIKEAEKRWHKLNGKKQLGELIDLVKFIDGVREKEDNHKTLEDKKCTA